MLNSLLKYFYLGTLLNTVSIQEAAMLIKKLQSGSGNNEDLARLCKLAVNWVKSNSDPISLDWPGLYMMK
jgi:hypothetical protein